MVNIKGLKDINVVLCEEVRVEDNGKEFLIGVFSGILVVEIDAPSIKIRPWVEFTKESNWVGSLEIRASTNLKTVGTATIELGEEDIVGSIHLPPIKSDGVNELKHVEIHARSIEKDASNPTKVRKWTLLRHLSVEIRESQIEPADEQKNNH